MSTSGVADANYRVADVALPVPARVLPLVCMSCRRDGASRTRRHQRRRRGREVGGVCKRRTSDRNEALRLTTICWYTTDDLLGVRNRRMRGGSEEEGREGEEHIGAGTRTTDEGAHAGPLSLKTRPPTHRRHAYRHTDTHTAHTTPSAPLVSRDLHHPNGLSMAHNFASRRIRIPGLPL